MSAPSTALAIREAGSLAVEVFGEEYQAIRNGIARDLNDAEMDYVAAVSRQTGLSVIRKQLHARKDRVYNRDTKEYEPSLTIIVGIDGYRLIADRTGRWTGVVGPFWCGPDGQWRDVWLEKTPPAAAKFGVLRAGFTEPVWGTVLWSSYCQVNREGQPVAMWAKMGPHMLAKCAEALALRMAFPQELSGLCAEEEMLQADNPPLAARAEQPIKARAIAAPLEAPDPSNVHQHAQLRSLAEHGYPFSEKLRALGLESIEELDREQAKALILAGRTAVRGTPNATAVAMAENPPPPPPPSALPLAFTAQQIALFWASGADTGWTKEQKRELMRELYPDLLDASRGEVSVTSLSRARFDDLIGLFSDAKTLAYDGAGKPSIVEAGPPDAFEEELPV